jgi:trk system potassium uptake protein
MTICLINDPTLIPLMEPLDIDAYINPRQTTVSSILRHIRHGRVRGVYSIGDAEAEVIEAQVLSTSPIAGQLIRDIDFPEGVLVGAVRKAGKIVKPKARRRSRKATSSCSSRWPRTCPRWSASSRSPSTSSDGCAAFSTCRSS